MIALEILKAHWKKFAFVGCLLFSFAFGYWVNEPQSVTKHEETTSDKTTETKSEDNNIITVIKHNPDGTSETVVIDKTKTKEKKTEDKETSKTDTTIVAKSKYAVGVWAENPMELSLHPTYRVDASMRLFGNIWGGTSVNVQNRDFGLGLRVEF